MGNAGTGSKRAWQLDFRSAAVRRRTGGSGIVLLSATPAKNSPLEFYNLVQYIDHDAWARMGIRDPEQFIDRYLRIELRPVVDTKMEVVERSAVTGFQNLHELREVIFRYGEFKTAEDVGLQLPEPAVEVVEVDMSAAQSAKYDRYVSQIEAALESTRPSDKAQILGLLARMSLVAIHDQLDEGYSWKTADQVDRASSPKFAALTKRVLKNRVCGHIVFVDNVAAHKWVRQVLVDAGIPKKRIALLNAQTAKASADRQRIAREFNGSDEERPKYDVVIANAIAYEGIDLQRRTCAIHHLDLPWEPATLQQRNGRGVRQGNTLDAIRIYYYFARRSMDGLRFNLIQGKLGWMTELLRSQKRDTNNPGAQMDLGPEEILLLVSRDPEKTRKRLDEVKARREAEARKKVAEDAGRLLRSANARFRKAERTEDPAESARLRLEAEARLKDLASVDAEAWPWATWMEAVRSTSVLVPGDGKAPVFAGLRVGLPIAVDASRVQYGVFGRVNGSRIGLRPAGSARWQSKSLEDLGRIELRPEHLDPAGWPSDALERSVEDAGRLVESQLTWRADWPALGWSWADQAWREAAWQRHGAAIIEKLGSVRSWFQEAQRVPVVARGVLHVGAVGKLGGDVLPPTKAGWDRFVELAPASEVAFTRLDEAAQYWWGRKAPRDLLARARRERAA